MGVCSASSPMKSRESEKGSNELTTPKKERSLKCIRCRDMSRKCDRQTRCQTCRQAHAACRYPAETRWLYVEDTATTKADLAIDTLDALEEFMRKNKEAKRMEAKKKSNKSHYGHASLTQAELESDDSGHRARARKCQSPDNADPTEESLLSRVSSSLSSAPTSPASSVARSDKEASGVTRVCRHCSQTNVRDCRTSFCICANLCSFVLSQPISITQDLVVLKILTGRRH